MSRNRVIVSCSCPRATLLKLGGPIRTAALRVTEGLWPAVRNSSLQATLVFAFLLGLACRLEGSVIQARSASSTDVAAAIDSASTGDTVMVPAGTADWTHSLIISKSITLQGAGMGQTILLDDVEGDKNLTQGLIRLDTQARKFYRLTGFEIRRGTRRTKLYFNGAIQVQGSSTSFRIDHIKFDAPLNRGLFIKDAACGVVDHCLFNLQGTAAIFVFHTAWAGKRYGDGSFATPVQWGSSNAVYIEDCAFSGGSGEKSCIDSHAGARWVFRYNTVTNEPIICHGTESGGRNRSTRSYEIYMNKLFDSNHWPNAIMLRGGTGVIWGNTAVGFRRFCRLGNFRSISSFRPWGGASGLNPWDNNDPAGPFASGVHNGPANSDALVQPGAGWKANQWVGYSLHNNTRGGFSLISSNTSDAIYYLGPKEDKKYTPPDMLFSPGDGFKIYRVQAALDQIGGSTCDLISGDSPRPAWPHQSLEPLYAWNNTLDGVEADLFTVFGVLREGEHFFSHTRKPGYTPFIYPHPLTMANGGGT